jgi:hypothetical protein
MRDGKDKPTKKKPKKTGKTTAYEYESPFDLISVVLQDIEQYMEIRNEPYEETKDMDFVAKTQKLKQSEFVTRQKDGLFEMIRTRVNPLWKETCHPSWSEYQQSLFEKIKQYNNPELWIDSEITRNNKIYYNVYEAIKDIDQVDSKHGINLIKLCLKIEILNNLREQCREFEKMCRVLDREEHKGGVM